MNVFFLALAHLCGPVQEVVKWVVIVFVGPRLACGFHETQAAQTGAKSNRFRRTDTSMKSQDDEIVNFYTTKKTFLSIDVSASDLIRGQNVDKCLLAM